MIYFDWIVFHLESNKTLGEKARWEVDDEQDMLGTAGEVRTNSWAMFSYGLLHINPSVLVHQQKCVDIGCHLEELPKVIANRDIKTHTIHKSNTFKT